MSRQDIDERKRELSRNSSEPIYTGGSRNILKRENSNAGAHVTTSEELLPRHLSLARTPKVSSHRPRLDTQFNIPNLSNPEELSRLVDPDRFSENILRKTSEKNLERNPGKIPEKTSETTPEKILEIIPEKSLGKTPEKTTEKIPEKSVGKTPEKIPEKILGKTPEKIPGTTPEKIPGRPLEKVSGRTLEKIPGTTPEKIPGRTLEKNTGKTPTKSVEKQEKIFSSEKLNLTGWVKSDKDLKEPLRGLPDTVDLPRDSARGGGRSSPRKVKASPSVGTIKKVPVSTRTISKSLHDLSDLPTPSTNTPEITFDQILSNTQLWKEFYDYLESECREQILLLYKDLSELRANPDPSKFRNGVLKIDDTYIKVGKKGLGSFVFEEYHRKHFKEILEKNYFPGNMLDVLWGDIIFDLKSLFVGFEEERRQSLRL